MTLLITSDAHGALENLKMVSKKHRDVDYHLDAGDICLPRHLYEPLHLVTVKGNNDFGSDEPYTRILDLNGLRVMLTHGHREHVKLTRETLLNIALAERVDVVIYGHTHRPYYQVDQGITIINPGALGDYRKSYAIYADGQVTFYEL